MKIYKLERLDEGDYDTYDSAVVFAESATDAVKIHPNGWDDPVDMTVYDGWTTLDNVRVTYIGNALPGVERGVVVASFNAG